MERVKWWIQKEFKVLPTDPRFQDLTIEQIKLMMAHRKLDMKPAPRAVNDPDYDKDAPAPQERYDDPDFDEEWDKADSDDGNDIIDENPPVVPDHDEEQDKNTTDFDDKNQWQEV